MRSSTVVYRYCSRVDPSGTLGLLVHWYYAFQATLEEWCRLETAIVTADPRTLAALGTLLQAVNQSTDRSYPERQDGVAELLRAFAYGELLI